MRGFGDDSEGIDGVAAWRALVVSTFAVGVAVVAPSAALTGSAWSPRAPPSRLLGAWRGAARATAYGSAADKTPLNTHCNTECCSQPMN
jgi:hypothetical protein